MKRSSDTKTLEDGLYDLSEEIPEMIHGLRPGLEELIVERMQFFLGIVSSYMTYPGVPLTGAMKIILNYAVRPYVDVGSKDYIAPKLQQIYIHAERLAILLNQHAETYVRRNQN